MPREKIFRFKQFSVVNDKTAMKVGTDGVLLGAWCNVDNAKTVLDVGTGCGVIALMIAQRNAHAMIHAIDIDANAIEEAKSNFSKSVWSVRLTAQIIDYNNYDGNEKYDLIISNPPFFTNGILPPNDQRNQARHTTSLTFSQLIKKSVQLLAPGGSIAIITPVEAMNDIKRCAVENHLWIKHLTQVKPIEGGAAKRILWQLTNNEVLPHCDELSIETTNHCFTSQYVALTQDFYLKM